MGSDRMFVRYVYNKPLMVKFPAKWEWQNEFNQNNKGALVWYTDRSMTNKGSGVRTKKRGLRRGHSFSFGLHTTAFQAEIYTIKACILTNTEKGYTGRNIYILSNRQAAIKALDSFHIHSKLVWNCHQSLVKLAK